MKDKSGVCSDCVSSMILIGNVCKDCPKNCEKCSTNSDKTQAICS